MPPPAPENPVSSPPAPAAPSTPLPQPSETVAADSSGKSNQPSPSRVPVEPKSPRPDEPHDWGMMACECFVWSGRHDTDEEFLRRYGLRPALCEELHGMNPVATVAIERLMSLLNS